MISPLLYLIVTICTTVTNATNAINVFLYRCSSNIDTTLNTCQSYVIIISHKPVRYTRKLLNIRSKLVLIPFTSFVEYVFFFFFFAVRNIVGKIDKRDCTDWI